MKPSERRKKLVMRYLVVAVTLNLFMNAGAYLFHWWK